VSSRQRLTHVDGCQSIFRVHMITVCGGRGPIRLVLL
jgi:hypothetical protein